jgi:hypothetical protein
MFTLIHDHDVLRCTVGQDLILLGKATNCYFAPREQEFDQMMMMIPSMYYKPARLS